MRTAVHPIRSELFIWLVMFLVLFAAFGYVMAGSWRDRSAGQIGRVSLTSCIARQMPGDRPEAVLMDQHRFDCSHSQAAWGTGDYWVKLTPPPGAVAALAAAGAAAESEVGAEAEEGVQLRFSPDLQRALTIYLQDSGGNLIARRYDDESISRSIRLGGVMAVPLNSMGQPVSAVLMRIDGALNSNGLLRMPQLVTSDQLHTDELVATALTAAFAGLGIGLFCYNIVVWAMIRERFQLTYCLSLLAMLAYVWASSGAMVVQFPGIPHDGRLAVNYDMQAFVAALSLQFLADILEPDALPIRLRQMARHYGLVVIASAIAISHAPEDWRWFAARVFGISMIFTMVMAVALIWSAWRRGSQVVRVLSIAWAPPIFMGTARIAGILGLMPPVMLFKYSILGMGFEVLLSSLVMSHRVKRIAIERDQAQADERTARRLANVDSLTGLLNRRALLEQVIAWESPEPLRLLILDVDHFKRINDTHGHLTGDEVLRDLAETLAIRADLRASVARLGGEEFALVGTAEELNEELALGILADIRSRPMAGHVRVTVSLGMAEGMVRCEDDWRELYRRADAALYRAKAEGRNRAVHAPREQHEARAQALA